MSNNGCKLAGNTGKEYIRFHDGVFPGLSSGNTHVDFQVIDGTFHNSSDFVKGILFIGIPLNARKHAEIQIFIRIGGASLFGCTAGIIAFASPLSFLYCILGIPI